MKAVMGEKICSISFDVWGTLIDLNSFLKQMAGYAKELIKRSEIDLYKRILEAYEASKNIRRRDPQINPLELLEKSRELMAKALDTSPEQVDLLISDTISKSNVNSWVYDDVLPSLGGLKAMGLKLGVIGNVLFWSSDITRKLLDRVGLSGFFDVITFADKTGFSKPDREIFLEYSKAIGCEPERILHIGDNLVEDVGGPLSAGFYAVLIRRGHGKTIVVSDLRVAVIRDMRELVEVISYL